MALQSLSHDDRPQLGSWLSGAMALDDKLQRLPEGELRASVEQVLAKVAWLAERSTLVDGYLGPLLQELNDRVENTLTSGDGGDVALSHASELRVHDTTLSNGITEYVRRALQQSVSDADLNGQRWANQCAGLLLAPDGSFDRMALASVHGMVTNNASLLPPNARREMGIQLERLMDPASPLPGLIDRLSSVDPLHPSVQRLVELQAGLHGAEPRHRVAQLVTMFLLTVPRQNAIGNCWLMSPNQILHLSDPAFLLERFQQWFETGEVVVDRPDGTSATMHFDLYPARAMMAADRKCAEWANDPPTPVVRAWRDAVTRACPGLEAGAVSRAVTQIEGHYPHPRPMQVVRQVLMTAHGLNESVLNRPRETLKPHELQRIEAFEQGVLDVMTAFESDFINGLTNGWSASFLDSITNDRLDRTWKTIEENVLASAPEGHPPKGWSDYLAALKAQFLACAELRHETEHVTGKKRRADLEVGLRLTIREPGTAGRGMPVRHADDLSARLTRMAADVARQNPDFPDCGVFLEQSLKAQAWTRKPRNTLPLPTPEVAQPGIWFQGTGYEGGGHLSAGLTVSAKRQHLGLQNTPFGWDMRRDFRAQIVMEGAEVEWHNRRLPTGKDARSALEGLLKMMRHLKREFPDQMDTTLKKNFGLLPLTAYLGSGMRHAMKLVPDFPLFKEAAQLPSGDVDAWIRTTLEKPMKGALRNTVDDARARQWLGQVLLRCSVVEGADRELLARQIMARVRKKTVNGVRQCSYKALVGELARASSSGKPPVFSAKDPRRNGLSCAVLSALPGVPPCMIYADTNWDAAPLMAYAYDPVTRKIQNFVGRERHGPTGATRFEFQGVEKPMLV